MVRAFNYFYKTENLINGKFYYGVHSTNNLHDNYLGSGTRLNYSIKKYGKKNFKKQILKFFETFGEALDYESEFVTENLIEDPSCYNLMVGGKGGNNGKGKEWYKIHTSNAGKNCMKNKLYRDEWAKKQSEKWKNPDTHPISRGFLNKKHSKKTKEEIGIKSSIYQKGEKNSQYGTCWITNHIINKKIKKNDPIPIGWELGRKLK